MKNTLIALAALAPLLCFADGAGGVQWKVPDGWSTEAQRPMRAATYTVPTAKGAAEPGECAVFYFGQGQGGDVTSNLKRWYGQFEQPDGKASESLAKTSTKKTDGMNVTTVDLAGTYLASMGGPMSPKTTPKPGYRLLGAIVEGPQGAVFFKCTGPAATIEAARPAFDKLLASVRKG